MPCYHPLAGYRDLGGRIKFVRTPEAWGSKITVACGQCVGCGAEKSRQWAVRGMHELETTTPTWKASFITLTYSDENLPENGNLQKRDWQLFAKRLRSKCGPFRFFMCGEYTDEGRPHFHAAIYNHDFREDREFYKKTEQNLDLFISPTLDEVWDQGYHTIGNVTFDSINYVASYINKRVTGARAETHYQKVNTTTGECFDQVPEFALMSRGGKDGYGLGHEWIKKHHAEVYPFDEVIINGVKASPPDYYDRWYAKHYPREFEEVKAKRRAQAKQMAWNNSPERLAVRKQLFTSRYGNYKKKLR